MTERLQIVVFWLIMISTAWTRCFCVGCVWVVVDSTCYLDAAEAIRQGRFSDALSSYWSPGYPIVIALVMRFLNHEPRQYFSTLNAANFIIFIFALFALEIFVEVIIRCYSQSKHQSKQLFSALLLRLNIYLIFSWCFLTFGGLQIHTPDMLLGAFVLLLVALTMSMSRREENGRFSKGKYALAGVLFGCAYLTKAFGLVLLPILLPFMLWHTKQMKQRLIGLILCIIGFSLIALPFSLALKLSDRGTTFGTAFLLNYHWQIEHTDEPSILFESADRSMRAHLKRTVPANYQPKPENSEPFIDVSKEGGTISLKNPFGTSMVRHPLDTGKLKHPPEKISQLGNVFYFGKPIPGTCPLWFDVGYWQEGIKVSFSPVNSLTIFLINWGYFIAYFLSFAITGAIVVGVAARGSCFSRQSLREAAVLWTVPLFALFLYSLNVNVVNTHPIMQRYFAPFVFLFSCAFLVSLQVLGARQRKVSVVMVTGLNILFCWLCLSRTSFAADDYKKDLNRSKEIAKALNDAGLTKGAQLAVAAPSQSSLDLTWARMADTRITAEIVDPASLWSASNEERAATFNALRKHGIVAIVNDIQSASLVQPLLAMPGQPVDRTPESFASLHKSSPGWRQVPNTEFFYYLL